MYRLPVVLMVPVLFSAFLFSAFAPAAPVPRHLFPQNPAYYFPTSPGTTWVYDNGNSLETHIISKVETVEEGRKITIEKVLPGGRTPYGILIISTSRVIQVEFEGKKLDEPLLWIKTPLKTGDTWDWKFLNGTTGTDTVRGMEKLEVPGGTFEAVKVDSKMSIGGGGAIVHSTNWYASGVGLLKTSFNGNDQRVLKSFSPGKD